MQLILAKGLGYIISRVNYLIPRERPLEFSFPLPQGMVTSQMVAAIAAHMLP